MVLGANEQALRIVMKKASAVSERGLKANEGMPK